MNADFGTNAQALRRKRVRYEGTSTIREGAPLCYDHDTTTNVLRYDKGNSVVGNTTAEGNQNEGKYKLVEDPSIANSRFFAGVVVGNSENGKVGPDLWLDIYVPNGAIVAVWTDKSVTIGDAAYLEDGELTVTNSNLSSGIPQIGWFMETVDRSQVPGIVLAKIQQPEMSAYDAGATLGIGLSPLLWGDAPKDVTDRPGDGMHFFNDFQNYLDPASTKPWIITQVDTKGSISFETGVVGGVIQFTSASGDSADDGINAQNPLVVVLPAAGTNIWFEARIKVSEADEQWAIGLAALDTHLIAAGIFDDVSDKVLFGHHTGTADKINTITARAAAEDETADVADMSDDTWVTVGFKITGLTTVDFYVDGVLVESGALTANVPNAAMMLTAVAQYEAADTILSVDWVKVQTDGGRDA